MAITRKEREVKKENKGEYMLKRERKKGLERRTKGTKIEVKRDENRDSGIEIARPVTRT